VSSRFDNILNCTRIWNDFRIDVLGGPYSNDRRRYIRLNPDLGFKVPKLDALDQLHDIQQAAHDQLKNNARIKEVAHRLVASTFFFEKIDATTREADGKHLCEGMEYFNKRRTLANSLHRFHLLQVSYRNRGNESSRAVYP
jgi:hypothetical protein